MDLPLNIFYWLLSTMPILILLILMIHYGWGASSAAPLTLGITIVVSFIFFKSNITVVFIELLKSLWNSLSIILVIITAVLLYEVSSEAKAFSVLNKMFKKIAPNELIRIMLIGIAFASFLQGVTGFGVPVLVAAPLLLQIGVKPTWAVIIPLIGHSWAGTFGTLALAWHALILQSGVDGSMVPNVAIYASILLFVLNLISTGAISYFYGGFKGFKKGFLAIILLSITQGGGQVFFSQINADLAVFIPSAISLFVLILLSKTPLYRQDWKIDDSKVMSTRQVETEEVLVKDNMTVNEAFIPYYLMTAITLLVLLIPPVNQFLGQISYGPAFMETKTGFGVVNAAVTSYGPIKPLTHASTFLLLSSILAYIYYRRKRIIKDRALGSVFKRTMKKVVSPTLAVISLISISRVMAGTGQTLVLAEGVALVLGSYYVVLAPFIGLLGSFITGSNMSSNILFGDFQLTTSNLIGLNSSAILGSQTAGGAIGTSIAPGNIVLGTTTAGILGSEGEVLKKIIPFTLIIATIFGLFLLLDNLLIY